VTGSYELRATSYELRVGSRTSVEGRKRSMSEETEIRHTKAELLERMAGTRAEVEAAIAGKDAAVLTRPGADGWSVKDHLAHLTAWQRSLIALLEGTSRSEALGIDEVAQEEESGFVEVNALLHERVKDQPLDRVLAEFRQSRQDLLAVLHRFSDDDLYKPYSHYQPNDPPYNPDPVIGWIVGNTFGHEEEHLGWFAELLRD
jgi:uncharacterized damage-inducible protein DinB